MTLGIGNNPLIVGLGQTGLSCIAFLERLGHHYHLLDSRTDVSNRQQFIEHDLCRSLTLNGLEGDYEHHLHRLESLHISCLIVSPGVRVKGALFDAARSLGLDIIGDIELFARALEESGSKVVAISGSNGKSTVTQLLYELLEQAGMSVAVGGNIGIPVLDLLVDPKDLYVLELSSFQLETTQTLSPVVATVLNVTEDHMDRYDSFAEYRDAKLSLLPMSDTQVIDIDELPDLSALYPDACHFSLNRQLNEQLYWDPDNREIHFQWPPGKSVVIDVTQFKLAGLHNVRNVMTVLALCQQIGLEWTEQMSRHLYQWPGLPHRCAFVAEINDIRFYNDSKATNVGATKAAIDGFAATSPAPIVLIAGGVGKGADFSGMAETFRRYLRALVLMGRDAEILLAAAGKGIPSRLVGDMKEAVETAYKLAKAGDIVLLSPACASLDMYTNFEQRGDDFSRCVEALV